jgi:hypothetical protein
MEVRDPCMAPKESLPCSFLVLQCISKDVMLPRTYIKTFTSVEDVINLQLIMGTVPCLKATYF